MDAVLEGSTFYSAWEFSVLSLVWFAFRVAPSLPKLASSFVVRGGPAALPHSAYSPPRFWFGAFPPMTMSDQILLGLGIPRNSAYYPWFGLHSVWPPPCPTSPPHFGFGWVRLPCPVPPFLLLVLGSGGTGDALCQQYCDLLLTSSCAGGTQQAGAPRESFRTAAENGRIVRLLV